MSAINAVPTMYKGIQMRSRLEAQWARVFDELGITWVYEPVGMELSANGESWIPDFAIKSVDGKMILVEIKPLTDLDLTGKEIFDAYPSLVKVNRIAKITGAPVIVLGSDCCFFELMRSSIVCSLTCVGLILGCDESTYIEIQISSTSKGWHDVELACPWSVSWLPAGYDSAITVGHCAFEREGKKQRKNDQLDFTEVWSYCKNDLQWRKPVLTH